MKKAPLLLLALLLRLNAHAQIHFEKGYYIDNKNRKVECFIKDADWANNPDSFLFKHSENEEPQKATIDTIQEFEIYNLCKYVRVTCDIDRSSDEMTELSTIRTPEFKTETLFLKVLVEGKASLFSYRDENLIRFFFKTDSIQITQLIFKLYKVGEVSLGRNFTFRQQLINVMHCNASLNRHIENLNYYKDELIKIFTKYNSCSTGQTENISTKTNHDVFNLWIRPRLTSSSLSASTTDGFSVYNFQFDTQQKLSMGIEAEFILPFKRNTWAITIEPTYQSYKTSITKDALKVNYAAIEVPIGIRHYFFLSDNSKLSLTAAFQMNFSNNSTLVRYTSVVLEIRPDPNFAFEAGYVFKNKLCVAYRYQTPREMLGVYQTWTAHFNSMAIVVGYSIF